MTTASPKSVITCDMEGRILTFGKDAEAVFGYPASEIVGKKRVSLFSPGLVVLEHVPTWLSSARKDGAFETDTVFVKKDGTPFAAHIKITPTWDDKAKGVQQGYCGVTTPLVDKRPEDVMPKVSVMTRVFAWLVVTRAPFLSATLVPLLLAAAAVASRVDAAPFPWLPFVVALVGATLLHVAANVWNDYYDGEAGVDEANNDYFLPFTGGSRAVELGLVTPRGQFVLASVAALVAAVLGVWLALARTPLVVGWGLGGLFLAWAYTAPPLRLIARRGLGELAVALAFGPLLVGGMLAVLEGGWKLEHTFLLAFLGGPIGFLTTAILYVNEFPDLESDARTGKHNLVVTLGRGPARHGYAALLVLAFALHGVGIAMGALPLATAVGFLTLPLALYAIVVVYRHAGSRALISANRATIALQALFGLLVAGALAFA